MRACIYFFAAFLTSLGAGVQDKMTAENWVRLLALSAGAGAVAVRGLFDPRATTAEGQQEGK